MPRRIDAHNHISSSFPTDIREWGHVGQTAEKLIEELDLHGFDQAVVFPEPYDWDYREAHDDVGAAVRRYPDRLIPLALVNPRSGQPGLDEIERCVREHGARGVKVRPDSQPCPANSMAVRAVFEVAIRLKLPVFIHSGFSANAHPLAIGDVVQDYPEVSVVMQHMFDLTGRHSLKVALRHANVYLETSGVYSPYLLREAIDRLGPHRVMFGSDTPYLPREVEAFKLECLQLSESVSARVFGENAAALLGI